MGYLLVSESWPKEDLIFLAPLANFMMKLGESGSSLPSSASSTSSSSKTSAVENKDQKEIKGTTKPLMMFANNALLGGGVRDRVWIREQRKIKKEIT